MTSYKHSKGEEKWIRLNPKTDKLVCPVTALKYYLQCRPNVSGLLFVHMDGKPMTDGWLNGIIKSLSAALGLKVAL